METGVIVTEKIKVNETWRFVIQIDQWIVLSTIEEIKKLNPNVSDTMDSVLKCDFLEKLTKYEILGLYLARKV